MINLSETNTFLTEIMRKCSNFSNWLCIVAHILQKYMNLRRCHSNLKELGGNDALSQHFLYKYLKLG